MVPSLVATLAVAPLAPSHALSEDVDALRQLVVALVSSVGRQFPTILARK